MFGTARGKPLHRRHRKGAIWRKSHAEQTRIPGDHRRGGRRGGLPVRQRASRRTHRSSRLFVPAAPGGGWDQTARTMDQVLRTEKLISGAQITNVARRRRNGRPAAVHQPVERPAQRADGRRHGHGRRDHRQQGGEQSYRGDADRAPDRRVRGAGGAGGLAVPDGAGFRRRAEGRSDQGSGRGRLGRRLRPHPVRPDRQDGRRAGDQPFLRALRGRRRGAGSTARQPGGGGHLRLRRIRRTGEGRRAPAARHLRRQAARKASTRRR